MWSHRALGVSSLRPSSFIASNPALLLIRQRPRTGFDVADTCSLSASPASLDTFVGARKNQRMAAGMCLVCQLCRMCFRKIWSIILSSEKTSTGIRPNSNEIDLGWWDDDSDHLLRRLLMQCCHSILLNLSVGDLSSRPPAFKAYPKQYL